MLVVFLSTVLGQVWVEAPAYDTAWQNPPVRASVPADAYLPVVTDMESGLTTPAKIQQHRDKRYVYWSRDDDGTKPRRYRIDFNTESNDAEPAFVGAGDMLNYGRTRVTRDLGIGLWASALPIDWNGDGMTDLVYSVPDVPQSGVYIYLQTKPGVFEQAERLGDGHWHPALGDMNGDGKVDLLAKDVWFDNIRENGVGEGIAGPVARPEEKKYRSFMVRQVDWDNDGRIDIVSAGGDWNDYGWDLAYDQNGNWTRGPLHGPLFYHRNFGSNDKPLFSDPVRLEADDHPIDIYGSPVPCIADWDGDGDFDLICGEFRDEFTYFENKGTLENPRFDRGQPVMTSSGPLKIELCMMSPIPYDWDGDGRTDLVIGQEDGRVSIAINRGLSRGAPSFAEEKFLREASSTIKSGGLVTPWIDPATRDLYVGNTAGFIERFAWVRDSYQDGRRLSIDRDEFRIEAGYNGSVQGPAEEKWGYTVLSLGDVDQDGAPEILYNSIFGQIQYLEMPDTRGRTTMPTPVRVAWKGEPPYPVWNWWRPGPDELVVQWRTRPLALDWDQDGVTDIVAVDHEGYLALYKGRSDGYFTPGDRVFKGEDGKPLRLNEREGGGSGRAKIQLVDWDADGDLDLLRNTQNTGWFENVAGVFTWRGDFPGRKLAGHTTAPAAFDWNEDGKLDLLVGAEDGHIYCYHRAAIEEPEKITALPYNN